ncbi:MAG: hypothetical protein H6708_00725 [Kofleriaceae bacterium]|nr:hypothetical protein [Kofleriaceae bacterium]
MSHRWEFFRAGGVDQVSLRNGADLLALPELDQKLWVALAMPTAGVDIDPATLAMIDIDNDGRIRIADVLTAIEFVAGVWVEPGDVLASKDVVALAALKDGKVKTAARRVLTLLDKPDAKEVTLGDALEVVKTFEKTRFNGDGVVTPASAGDEAAVAQVIEDVIATVGSVPDRSGKPGVDAKLLETFGEQIDRLAAWAAAGEATWVEGLGAATGAAHDALVAIRAKLEDYFARARVVAFDPRAAAALGGTDEDLAALRTLTLTGDAEEVARLPLAPIDAGGVLRLAGPLNPAWTARLDAFMTKVVTPLLGERGELTAADLATVAARFDAHAAWRKDRPDVAVDKLGLDRVAAIAGGDERARIAALIAEDLEVAPEYDALTDVEKTLRLQRDLGRVLRNFVNFSDFYSRKDGAFQCGTLYLDARASRLCLPVADAGKHATLAPLTSACLAYCDVVRGATKKSIVAAFTNGDAEYVFVGRNGVYYDRKGDSWDATITKVVSNPISVREAFWAPYKKLVRMVEDLAAKRAQAAEAAADAKVGAAATQIATADKAAAAAAPAKDAAKPAPKKIDIGTVAAIGVAVGGIGAMVVGIVAAFTGLGAWMPLGLLALLLLISGPSMMLAWMKLRHRSLGPILDANGWAINGRARVNVAFGAALTELAALPPGSRRNLDDPYADKQRPWRLYLVLLVLLGLGASWYVGALDRWLPGRATSRSVLGDDAPAASKGPLLAPPPAPPPAG